MRRHDHRSAPGEPGHQRGPGRGREEMTGGGAGDDVRRGRGHHGPGGRGGRGGGGRGRGRAQRGDVRTAILLLLHDQPMHGYQLMQAISDRTQGAWRPSPGAVYPTIDQLEDEGLATIHAEGGRRLVTLTSEGHAYVAEHGAELSDPFAEAAESGSGRSLREPLDELRVAARQVALSGSAAQTEAAARVLAQAKRSLYLILAGESDVADE